MTTAKRIGVRSGVLVFLLGATCASLWACRALWAQEPAEKQAEHEIRALEREFDQAVLRADRGFFERVLAPDFTHTSHAGAFKTRSQWMSEHKWDRSPGAPKPGQTRYTGYDIGDLSVRLYGNTAVVTGRSAPRGTNAKGQPITGRYRFLRVWVKRQGGWQVVAFQGTRISEP